MNHSSAAPVIIVRKKVKRHGAHHGGAWKVAYADFVTAMMALFIVLWLMNSSENVKKAVAGYFQDPSGSGKEAGTSATGFGESMSESDMGKLKARIEAAFKKLPQFQGSLKDRVVMTVTGEGLRIEFLETENGLFFHSGSESPTEDCRELLAKLTQETAKLPNALLVEGHTDSRPFSASSVYTNWELSAGRANAARRVMIAAGTRDSQISQVRGFADQRLRLPKDATNAANRRISIVIQTGSVRELPTAATVSEAKHEQLQGQEKASPHP